MTFKLLAMKKTFQLLLTAIAGLALLASCSIEQPDPVVEQTQENKQLVEVRFKAANPGGTATKTSMEATSDGYSLSWTPGDQIGVTSLIFEDTEDQWGYTFKQATLYPFITEEGGATASFSGKLQAGESYHFFYPIQFRYEQMGEGGGEMLNSLRPRTSVRTKASDGEDDDEDEEQTPEFMSSQVTICEYGLNEQNEEGEWDYYEAPEGGIPVASTSVPRIQYPQAGSFDGYADIMVATNTIDVPSPEPGVTTVEISTSPSFTRLVAFLRTSIKDATDGWFDGQHIKEIYLRTENSYDCLTASNAYIDLLNNTIAIDGYGNNNNNVTARYDENTWYTPAADGSQSTYFAVLPGQIHTETPWGGPNMLTFGGETEDVRFMKVVPLQQPIILEQGKVTNLSFKITQDFASRRPAVDAIVIEGLEGDGPASFDIGGRPKNIGFTPTWEDDGKGMWPASDIVDPKDITVTSSKPQVAEADIISYYDYYDELYYETSYNYEDKPYVTYYLSVCPAGKGTTTITVAYGDVSTSFEVNVDDPEFINFADQQVAAVAPNLEGWDYNGDGHISINEAKDVTEIPSGAFSGNTELASFDDLATYFPNLVYISSNAFSGCTNLASITFPEGVSSIGDNAFNGCTSLEELNLPPACTSLGEQAFQGCSALTEIHLPASQSVSFRGAVFAGCSNVTNVTGQNASADGRCIIHGDGQLYYFFPAGLESYKFPANIKSILYGTDFNSVGYTYSLNLLYGNTALKVLDFSDTGLKAYDSGTNSMITSSGVERIILPRGMSSFGDYCFGGNIKDVVFTSPTAPNYGSYPFNSAGNVENFYIPFQSYDLYMEKFSSYSNFTSKAKPDVTDLVCTNFSITAGDVHGRESCTRINWTYTYNGTLYNGDPVTGQSLTGTAISEDFGQNTADSPRQVTVSYSMLEESASCTISQGAWDTEWVSAQPDGTQWRVATSVPSVAGVPFAYNLYESDSNYSAQDGNANIRILVEGYQHKTIRFYVISSGHTSYSYLWVMKPNMEPLQYMYNPSTDSNSILSRTYRIFGERDGVGPSGTDFSHYREVVVNDVSDGDVIWVQYGKSEYWWNTPWNGRGFLLMPLVQD